MQGFNKYYPPDYTPEAGSLNKYNGKHALGDRARKLDKGILIVRFELPFNIWCDTCNNHIGMGVRYNAEKSKVGMYYTTPILNFRCKCHLCQSWFEIRTDPQNTRYVVFSGARQKNEEWDPVENGTIVLDEKKTDEGEPDPFDALEKAVTQKKRALSAAAHLDALESLQSSRWSDPYSASNALRSAFRKEKKVRVESDGRAEATRDRYALGDRVKVQDLKTPAAELKIEEDRDWDEARRERERREDIRLGKRKRELNQVGWTDEVGRPPQNTTAGGSGRPASTSTRPTKRLSSRPPTQLAKSISSNNTSSSSSFAAVRKLASNVLLNSALKADPFGSERSQKKSRTSDLVGVVKIKTKKGFPG